MITLFCEKLNADLLQVVMEIGASVCETFLKIICAYGKPLFCFGTGIATNFRFGVLLDYVM